MDNHQVFRCLLSSYTSSIKTFLTLFFLFVSLVLSTPLSLNIWLIYCSLSALWDINFSAQLFSKVFKLLFLKKDNITCIQFYGISLKSKAVFSSVCTHLFSDIFYLTMAVSIIDWILNFSIIRIVFIHF